MLCDTVRIAIDKEKQYSAVFWVMGIALLCGCDSVLEMEGVHSNAVYESGK
jgi:hypothetical protein